MESRRRKLTEEENNLLSKMDLSPKARLAVEEVWVKEMKPLSAEATKKYRVLIPITPLMVVVLGANLLYPSPLLSKLSAFSAVMAWGFDVGMYLFGMLLSSLLVLLNVVNPLSYLAIAIAVARTKASKLLVMYNNVLHLSLIILLALNGYVITGVAVAIAWAIGSILRTVAKDKVDKAIQAVEEASRS